MSWLFIHVLELEMSGFFPLEEFSSPVTCFCACLGRRNWREIFFERNKSPGVSPIFRTSLRRTKTESDFSDGRCPLHFLLNLSATSFIHSVLKISDWLFVSHQSLLSPLSRVLLNIKLKLKQVWFQACLCFELAQEGPVSVQYLCHSRVVCLS